METEHLKNRRYGGRSHHHWYALATATRALARALTVCGLYDRGARNALNLIFREVTHRLPRLPASFDGFTILQLSDLHLDGIPGFEQVITDTLAAALGQRSVDLCVITGDYREGLHGPIAPAIKQLTTVVQAIRSHHGIVGIMGNHDSWQMVAPLEQLGIRMLINEQLHLERDGSQVCVIGTDDVHYYFTHQAAAALEQARQARCSIALVHSPELYDVAAENGVDLYLCGHTHGGQICLPGGRPVITHLTRGHALASGLWNYRGMQGYTHRGTGTSGIPIRFNTRGEIVLHRLRRTNH